MEITPVKTQTNLKPSLDNQPLTETNVPSAGQSSFADHMADTFETVAQQGYEAESISTNNANTTDLAMAMDQFLVELNALKALVDETRKSLDRLFQEAKG